MWKVQLFKLNYCEKETQVVKDVVDSGWITMGEKTKEFENQFEGLIGNDTKAVAMSSCTAALHAALASLNIKEGDEVIIPALTFVADINVVKMMGATPVLADCSSLKDWNMDADSIKKQISSKTKAVIIVHFAGYPCEMDAIISLCQTNNIALIEDCAHAPGGRYKGKACGSMGDISCFSFFTNKNLSVGEGGMYVSKDDTHVQNGKYFRSHGMTALTLDRHKGRAITYDIVRPGLNYRIDEMRSALGLVQLDKLERANKQRKVLAQQYNNELKDLEGISLPFLDTKDTEPTYHIYPILLDENIDRLTLIEGLKNDGIQSSIHYPAFKDFTAFKDIGLNSSPLAEEIAKRELTLPLYPTMTLEMSDMVIASLKKTLSTLVKR